MWPKCWCLSWYRFLNNCAICFKHGVRKCLWFISPPFSEWFKKFHISEIVYWWCRSTWTAFRGMSCMQEPLPKAGVLFENLWQLHKLKIHKWVSRPDHLNISIMFRVFDWVEFGLSYLQTLFRGSRNNPECSEVNVFLKKHIPQKDYSSLWCVLKLSGRFHFYSLILNNLLRRVICEQYNHYSKWLCLSWGDNGSLLIWILPLSVWLEISD